MVEARSKANALSALFLAIVNGAAAFVGLPLWATPELVGMANSAVLTLAALVFHIVDRPKVTEGGEG